MILKFFDVVLKIELPNARFLNFAKNSAPVPLQLVLGALAALELVSKDTDSMLPIILMF